MLESVILTPVNVHVHYFTSVADLQSLKLHPAIFVHPYFFVRNQFGGKDAVEKAFYRLFRSPYSSHWALKMLPSLNNESN